MFLWTISNSLYNIEVEAEQYVGIEFSPLQHISGDGKQ